MTLTREDQIVVIPRRVQSIIDGAFDTSVCWIWDGARSAGGDYSNVAYRTPQGTKHNTTAHRMMYVLLRGQVPAEMSLDHLCRTPLCVNPWHLEVVTQRVNVLRGQSPMAQNATKTHCSVGHELSPDNLAPSGVARGRRLCRTCQRLRGNLITEAAHLLGLSRREYARRYGWSATQARLVIEAS